MPRYNRALATKSYVNRRIAESEWSPVQRIVYNFNGATVASGTGTLYEVEVEVINNIIMNEYTTTGDSVTDYTTEYRIKYITVHLRVQLGDSETLSATEQNVRVLLYRAIDTLNEAVIYCVDSLDGSPNWERLFGDINGLYSDKSRYPQSQLGTPTTTSSGQSFVHYTYKPMHSNTLISRRDGSGNFSSVDTEKGLIRLQVVGDDPLGLNAVKHGYIEIGYEYKN